MAVVKAADRKIIILPAPLLQQAKGNKELKRIRLDKAQRRQDGSILAAQEPLSHSPEE